MAETAVKPKTPQQIAAHCDKIDNMRLTAHPDGKLRFDSLQIIRQLIGECPRYSKSHNVDQFYD